ncbi:MAG: hypothetical protein WCW66_00560 [Patescibacteria group bacterium]
MSEGLSKFNEGGISNEDEQKKARIDVIRYEIMQIERKIMKLNIHRKPDSEAEISSLHERQAELLTELQQLENEN